MVCHVVLYFLCFYICQTHVLGRFQTGFFVPERPCSDLDKTLPLLTPHLKEKVCLAAKTIILDILSRHQISCVFCKVYATRDISCLQGGGGVVANWKCQILCCGQWPGFLLHPLILLWIYAYRPGKVQILQQKLKGYQMWIVTGILMERCLWWWHETALFEAGASSYCTSVLSLSTQPLSFGWMLLPEAKIKEEWLRSPPSQQELTCSNSPSFSSSVYRPTPDRNQILS